MKFKLRKGGQTWSFDLIVAVILFVVIVALFYAFLTADSKRESPVDLQDSARAATTKFVCDASESSTLCFMTGGEINKTALDSLTAENYADLKEELGLPGEFCIFLRGPDGKIIPIQNATGHNLSGIGDDTFRLNENTRCGDQII